MKLTNAIAHALLSSTLLLALSASADAARVPIFPEDDDAISEDIKSGNNPIKPGRA